MQKNQERFADIRFETRTDCLYAFVSGERDSLAVSIDTWTRIIDESVRRGVSKILVEEDFPNQVSTSDMYVVVNTLAEKTPSGFKIAFVDRRSTHHQLNMFGETVAVNRGVNGRVFAKLTDAEAWLNASPANDDMAPKS